MNSGREFFKETLKSDLTEESRIEKLRCLRIIGGDTQVFNGGVRLKSLRKGS